MLVDTLELAIHMPAQWHESIETSRRKLGYDPSWPVEKAMAWIEANYVDSIRHQADAELKRLELPPIFKEYWEDCFYCDYRRPDGSLDLSKISRGLAFVEVDREGNSTGKLKPGHKSLPPIPFTTSFPYDEEYGFDSPWTKIVIMVFTPMVSEDVLLEAIKPAQRHLSQRRHFSELIKNHPWSNVIHRAKINFSEPKRWALERYQREEIDFEGLMEEEWRKPEMQDELGSMIERYRRRPTRLQQEYRWLQKRVYDRVRRWLPDPKPRVKVKGDWRDRLPLPLDQVDDRQKPLITKNRQTML